MAVDRFYEITHYGQSKVIPVTATIAANYERFMANRAATIDETGVDPVKEVMGDHGYKLIFPPVDPENPPKNNPPVRTARGDWGLTHNRFTTEHPDYYVLVSHAIMAEKHANSDPVCPHGTNPPAEHVCHGIVEVPAKVTFEVDPDDGEASGEEFADALAEDGDNDAWEMEEDLIEAIDETPDLNASLTDQFTPPDAHQVPGHGLQLADVIKAIMGSGGDGATFMEMTLDRGVPTNFSVVANCQADSVLQVYKEAQRRHHKAVKPKFRADAFVTTRRAAEEYIKAVPNGFAATDLLKILAPGQPQTFDRKSPEFKEMQETYHAMFRHPHNLSRALKTRGYNLVKMLDEQGKEVCNEFNEVYWQAVPVEEVDA